MTGLPQRSLHIAIHGFVFENLQNRFMSAICKFAHPRKPGSLPFTGTLKGATPHNGLNIILHPD